MRRVYLNILGLKENASVEDIKKAYRKKAFEYHPDRNSSELAQAQFSIINDAYKNLNSQSNSEKEEGYNYSSTSKKYAQDINQQELDRRLENAKINKKRKENRERDILNISYKELQNTKFLKISNFVASLSILFSFLLLSDMYLVQPKTAIYIARKFEKDPKGQKIHLESASAEKTIIITTDIRDPNFAVIRKKYIIETFESKIFNQVYALRIFSHRKVPPMKNPSSFFSLFYLIFSLFLFPITNFVFNGPNIFYLIFVHLNIVFPIVGSLIILSFTL